VLGELITTDHQNKDRPVDTAQKTVVYSENYMKLKNALCWQFLKAYWLRDAPAGLTFDSCTLCPHCIYVFCIYLRANSHIYPAQHKLIGFYKRDERCLQRGTDWVFKLNSFPFVFIRVNFPASCAYCLHLIL